MTESQYDVCFNTQLAVIMRAVRTALVWTQQDLATKAKISKPTIARIETMDMSPRADTIDALLAVFRGEGVEVDISPEQVTIRFKKASLFESQKNLLLLKK